MSNMRRDGGYEPPPRVRCLTKLNCQGRKPGGSYRCDLEEIGLAKRLALKSINKERVHTGPDRLLQITSKADDPVLRHRRPILFQFTDCMVPG